jgi:predicted permease
MRQDIRLALRQLAHAPAFTIAAILTFALGIGANTAVFSVMNAVVLRLLPVSNPQEIVFLHSRGLPNGSSQTGFSDGSMSLTVYERLKAERRIFSALMAYVPLDTQPTAVRHGQTPETVWADMVSGDFFSGLGVRMAWGRGFTMNDEQQHAPIAVLSHAYWTRRFDRQPSALGETLFIKGVPFTIVGVTAPEFTGVSQNSTDVWIPIQTRPELKPWGRSAQSPDGFYTAPNWWFLLTVGRLAPGVTADQATAAAQPVFERAAYEHVRARREKEQPPKLYLTEARGIEGLREVYRRPLVILMAMVGLVLLIACGNVAMLLLARNAARQRELGLRTALGASRWRLLRQLAAESLLLVAVGTVLGWWFALAATRVLAIWSALDMPLTPDRTVLLFTIGVSVLAAVAFGLSPMRNATGVPLASLLRSSSSNVTGERRRHRFGHPVIAAQVALCFVLLVGAGLLVRTIRNLSTADLGMRTSGLLVFGVTPPASVHGDEAFGFFYQSLSAKLRTIGGVEGVTLMSNRIGSGWSNNDVARIDGKPALEGRSAPLRWNTVGSQYFHVLRVPMLLGRDFTDADDAAAPPVVIVNDTFAKRYLAGRNPLGHRVNLADRDYAIVGVAADSRYTSVRETPWPMAYLPYRQAPSGPMHVEIRTATDEPMTLVPAIQRVVQSYGPDIPLVKAMTQEQQFGASFSNERLFSGLATFFGLMAALLVATGLYGTLTYRISRRTSEIGVRIALGANRGQVLWMIVRESLVVAIVGIAMGVPLAILGARWLAATLFGLTPGDPLSFGLALAAVALVTISASLVPARRAATLDPMRALRSE